VLVASAITRSRHPERMAGAIRDAVRSGRAARQAGRITRRFYAEASSDWEGMVEW
jgi:thiazole synthase